MAFCPAVHFEGICDQCEAARMPRLTLDQVVDRYHTGRVSQTQYEAYRWIHASYSPYNRSEWSEYPTDPAVIEFGALLCSEKGLRVPAKTG